LPLVTLDRIAISFGRDALLDDASLQIEEGERLAIIGRNGTGKSTLLKILSGELPEHVNRLHADDTVATVRDERWHAADVAHPRQRLIVDHVLLERTADERPAQRSARHAEGVRERDEHVDLADVLAALEERLQQRRVVLGEPADRPRPVRGLVRAARARLHRRQPQRDAERLRERIDRRVPDALQVLGVRIERRHRVGAQLERAPDDVHVVDFRQQLVERRLGETAERADVVGKDLERHARMHGPIVPAGA